MSENYGSEHHSHNHTAGVVFHDGGYDSTMHRRNRYAKQNNQSILGRFFIKISGGLIKTNSGATHAMIIIAILLIGISVFVFWRGLKTNEIVELPIVAPEGETVIYPRSGPPRIR